MNSIEIVNRTLDFINPERIPVHLWWMPATEHKHGEKFKSLLQKYPLDIQYVGRNNPEISPQMQEIGSITDIWGCVWNNLQRGFDGYVTHHPLAELSGFKTYKPPMEQAAVGFEGIGKLIDAAHRKGLFCLASPGVGIFHRMDFLRGTMNLYLDLMDLNQDIIRLRDMVFEYKMKELQGYLNADIDGIQLNDDWGSQRSLLISPAIWRDFMKPCYQEYFAAVKKRKKRVFFHSDGYIMEIYPDLIEIGVEALNSQVWCMGVEELGRKFSGKITFYGELDRQMGLSNGKPEKIYEMVQIMKRCLSTSSGGLIGQAEVGPDVPLDAIEATLTAWNNI